LPTVISLPDTLLKGRRARSNGSSSLMMCIFKFFSMVLMVEGCAGRGYQAPPAPATRREEARGWEL
jgi:hypothetical protein